MQLEHKKATVDLIEAIVKWEMIRMGRTRIEFGDASSAAASQAAKSTPGASAAPAPMDVDAPAGGDASRERASSSSTGAADASTSLSSAFDELYASFVPFFIPPTLAAPLPERFEIEESLLTDARSKIPTPPVFVCKLRCLCSHLQLLLYSNTNVLVYSFTRIHSHEHNLCSLHLLYVNL